MKLPVPFAPEYEVDDNGNVYHKDRQLKPTLKKQVRYTQVRLGKAGNFLIHRIVAITFLGEHPELEVNHKNGIRHDNRLCNLEWVTPSENMKHKFDVLGQRGSCLGLFGSLHPTSKALIAQNVLTGEERHFACGMAAVKELGADSGQISRACNGKIKTHMGYRWRFDDGK